MNADFPVKLKRFVCLLLGVFFLVSCATTNKDEKFYAKQEARQIKQDEQDYETKVRQHKEIQSKQTLKMMKQSEKEAKKLNNYKKR
jgi:hypothetical protein